jgi:hypothetical protein
MLELTVLLISIVVILIVLYLRDTDNKPKQTEEAFENFYLSACPSGYKSFYNNEGNIVCCDGDVVANKCIGDNQCTLNGKGTPDMPNCVQSILAMYAEKGQNQCPTSMPTYYENKASNIKACTQGRLNDTLDAPRFPSQPGCMIYDSLDKNNIEKDSCYNQKQLELAQCFGNNCTKELTQPIVTAPPLVAVGFTDNTGMHRVAYTQQSLENFLDVSNPNWRNQGMDLSKNINVAEVAKAYYVDRTMEQAAVQF